MFLRLKSSQVVGVTGGAPIRREVAVVMGGSTLGPELTWLPTTDMNALDAAVLYAQHAWRAMPVHGIRDDGSCTCRHGADCPTKKGKHPVTPKWQTQATWVVDKLRDLFRSAPKQSNVGIVMGEQGDGTYLVAIDVDGEKGRATLAGLEECKGPLPPTLTSKSGRVDGGEHRLFILGPGQDPKRLGNVTALGSGLDVKVKGGQIVVCPSRHESGARYSWLNALPVAVLPDAWFEAIAKPIASPRPSIPPSSKNVVAIGTGYVQKVIANAYDRISSKEEGGRNSALYATTRTVLEYCSGHGLSWDEPLSLLEEAGVNCGLPRREVVDTIRKATRDTEKSGNVRHAPPPRPRERPSSAPPPSGRSIELSNAEAAIEETAETVDPMAWTKDLALAKTGGVKNSFGNVCLILRNDPEFAGRLSYNRMRVSPYLDGRPLRDADLARIREDIERRWAFSPGAEAVAQAVLLVGDECSFHPVQDYLNGLAWDGTKRIELVAREVLGIEAPCELTQRVLRAWFISAVARALDPGCKVDTTMVLTGPQGHKKSTFFATLGGEWFTDTYADIRSKDGILQVHAAWIYEWGEIERVTTRTSSSDVKAFLVSRQDDVRPPYGRGVITQKRSSVIVGTTNKPFLDDETGSRRFWPVAVDKLVDVALLKEWRDQLWAEAVAAFKAGEPWWLTEDEERARESMADIHMVENPWLERIAAWLREPGRRVLGVTIADVLVGALGIDIGKVQKGDETRVGKALRRLGWASRQETRDGARVRVHFPKEQFVEVVDFRSQRRHETVAQHAQLETVNNGTRRADDNSENKARSQPAQPAQPLTYTRESRDGGSTSDGGEAVPDTVVADAESDHLRARDRDPFLETGCAGRAGRAAADEVSEMTSGVLHAKHEVVQPGDAPFAEWLYEAGVGPEKND